MAKTDLPDDSFIREVDDAYRRDRLTGAWSSYGRWLIAAVVALLAILGGGLYWREEQARRAGVTGETFGATLTRLESGDAAGAAPALAELARRDDGYGALARLSNAAQAVKGGDSARALGIYSTLAADAAQSRAVRDLALIKATRLEFDTLAPGVVIARLKALALPGEPWFAVAGEMTAIAYLKNGQPTLAAPLFASLARDTSAPPTVRARAEQMASALGVPPAGAQPVFAGAAGSAK